MHRTTITLTILITLPFLLASPMKAQTPTSNIPYHDRATIPPPLRSLVWFGQVDPDTNYTDVRLAFNNDTLFISALVFDRIPRHQDAFVIYLNTTTSTQLTNDAYKIIARLNNSYQLFQGDNGTWQPLSAPVSVQAGYRGETGPGDNLPDAGWTIEVAIPFSSINQTTRSPDNTRWKAAFTLQDKDENDVDTPAHSWPDDTISDTNPDTWGNMILNPPTNTTEPQTPDGTLTIQQNPNYTVEDAMVGGGANCSDGFRDTRWSDFGAKNWSQHEQQTGQLNIQNQVDVADWLCFSKYNIQFPLSAIPQNVQVTNAKLVLQHFGNAGYCDPNVFPDCASQNRPYDSIIHAYTHQQPWNSDAITWNTTPIPLENVTKTRVAPIWECTDPNDPATCNTFSDPPIEIEWNLTTTVSEAFSLNQSHVNIILHSSDGAYHSGKYFYTSEHDQVSYRPALVIEWQDENTTPPQPGDYEPEGGDGDVDINDFWHVIQNFLSNYSIFDFNQVVTHFGN